MRDIQRIEKILSLIQSIWIKNPDMRLMQLLINALPREDNYYLEDDKLEFLLKEFYE